MDPVYHCVGVEIAGCFAFVGLLKRLSWFVLLFLLASLVEYDLWLLLFLL